MRRDRPGEDPAWCYYPAGAVFPTSGGVVCSETDRALVILTESHLLARKSVAYYTVDGAYFGDGNDPSVNRTGIFLCGSGIQGARPNKLAVSFCVPVSADDSFPTPSCWINKIQPNMNDGCPSDIGAYYCCRASHHGW
jgi:hypothetical protein